MTKICIHNPDNSIKVVEMYKGDIHTAIQPLYTQLNTVKYCRIQQTLSRSSFNSLYLKVWIIFKGISKK